jgi:phytoene desaturase
MSHIGIIGAGLGGLSSAAHLLSQGHQVTIFEQGAYPGGRAAKTLLDTPAGQYLTECGPTVFTMLDTARVPFEALGETMERHVDMIRVDPGYQGRFSDGSVLNWPGHSDGIHKAIASFAGHKEAEGFDDYVQWLEKLVRIEYEPFIAQNFASPLDLMKSPLSLLRLVSMGAFRKMENQVREFIMDERLISMSTFQALYAGVTPHEALAVYCIISYMDLVQGVFYPRGGMHKYAEALAEQCENHGAKINYNTRITQVQTTNGGVEVQSDGSAEHFDAVICNADLPIAYPKIFGLPVPRRVENAKYSPSCLLYVVGGSATSRREAHHTITFARNSKYGFSDLVKDRKMMRDPSFLVSQPTITDPSIAPEGTDVFYVLEPSPHLDSKVDFEDQREAHIERMRGHLAKSGVSFDRTDCEIFIDPTDWERQEMYKGTPFSMAHTFMQSGPFRAKNAVKELPGVFLTGTGTTPGVGIPMVIESGKLAAERVEQFIKAKKR